MLKLVRLQIDMLYLKNSHPIRLVDDVTNQNISLSACDEVIAILTLEHAKLYLSMVGEVYSI